ncbi:Beta-Casp domain [Carpediemonas membranifera]|uniref:Beta-Casp domain n=1 Tax=Carpediemonas membranifera TaxID=201153 RepID=A0A8J6DZD0_9EUKA|nr:Beta-Casp domain [Carpediemonas membranifera]|eukprot:KAG9390548.1 Beta-Casp domain [Carpediemonas membranifera]
MEEDQVRITPLGAGQEVGRSAILLQYHGKTVLLDCGIHPGHSGALSLPFLDGVDIASIDLLLISHFHLDHCGAIPHFTQKYGYKGPIYMTAPTRAFYQLILSDYVRVSHIDARDFVFSQADIQNSLDMITTVNYHQRCEHNGIKFWCYNAGHVLGAACWMVEIDGVRVLYTGDFTLHPDRHLGGAEIPDVSPDILIVESTYGTQRHEPADEREGRLTRSIARTLQGGGNVLLPVFALGRAQELLLVLEDFWSAHPELQGYPVYYISPLAQRCLQIFRTYVYMMNQRVQDQCNVSNPWNFAHITELDRLERYDPSVPCVVMCSPGMLQSGVSRQLFDMWREDSKNLVVITGYAVEDTVAKTIQQSASRDARKIMTKQGEIEVNCGVEVVSFSAHSDCTQTTEFVRRIRPSQIVLVHGEEHQMGNLRRHLEKKFPAIQLWSPASERSAVCTISRDRRAVALGTIAQSINDKKPAVVDGLVVSRPEVTSEVMLVDPDDREIFALHTGVQRSVIRSRSTVHVTSITPDAVLRYLAAVFPETEVIKAEPGASSGSVAIGGVTVEAVQVGTGVTATMEYLTDGLDRVVGELVRARIQRLVETHDTTGVPRAGVTQVSSALAELGSGFTEADVGHYLV